MRSFIGDFQLGLLLISVVLGTPVSVWAQPGNESSYEDVSKKIVVESPRSGSTANRSDSEVEALVAQQVEAERRIREIERQQELLQQREEVANRELGERVASVDEPPGLGVESGDERIAEMTSRLFQLIEGNAGALIMVLAGVAAIISAAFGAYRAAISLLVVAVGAFILRALVDIFFNYTPTI